MHIRRVSTLLRTAHMSFLHTCAPAILPSGELPPCTQACPAAGLQARGVFVSVCILLLVFLCVMKGLLLPPCSVQCSSVCTHVFCKSMAIVMLLVVGLLSALTCEAFHSVGRGAPETVGGATAARIAVLTMPPLFQQQQQRWRQRRSHISSSCTAVQGVVLSQHLLQGAGWAGRTGCFPAVQRRPLATVFL